MARRKDKSTQQNLVNDSAKALLANIRFMSVDSPIKKIVITSSIPNEGKTFVSINLAQAIASSNRTCLLIEGDLRKRSIARDMGVHPEHGLYAVISGEVPFNRAVAVTPQRGLYFLDAEPQIPNPPDLFGSKSFSDFLEKASEQVDYVVIDTPPVTTFVDSAVVAAQSDVTFLVVREDFTKKRFVTDACEQLRKADVRLGGVIMNCCASSSDSYYGYYGYYYDYYNYGSSEQTAESEKGMSYAVSDGSGVSTLESDDGKTGGQDFAPSRSSRGSHSKD